MKNFFAEASHIAKQQKPLRGNKDLVFIMTEENSVQIKINKMTTVSL